MFACTDGIDLSNGRVRGDRNNKLPFEIEHGVDDVEFEIGVTELESDSLSQ